MMHRHKHRTIPGRSETVGYSGCVAPYDCNSKSHGGVCMIDYCSCGAKRKTNSTGGSARSESSGWRGGKYEDDE